MAIYRLSAQVLKRTDGRNAVRAAAYRAAEKLHDSTSERSFDYSKKQGVVHAEILAPPNAPSWVYDRQRLWSEAIGHALAAHPDNHLTDRLDHRGLQPLGRLVEQQVGRFGAQRPRGRQDVGVTLALLVGLEQQQQQRHGAAAAQALGHARERVQEVGGRAHPEISDAVCTGCGECVAVCPANAIAMEESE